MNRFHTLFPIIYHHLRRGLRCRLWLLAGLLPPILVTPWLPELLTDMPGFEVLKDICRVTAIFSTAILYGVLLFTLTGSIAIHRRKPGLDPVYGSGWPTWRIAVEECALPLLLLLPLWLLYRGLFPNDFPNLLLSLLLICIWVQGALLMAVVTRSNVWSAPALLLILLMQTHPAVAGHGLIPVALVVLILLWLSYYALLLPPTANHAGFLRPALVAGTLFCAWVCPGDDFYYAAAPRDIIAVGGIILILASGFEKLQPSRRQRRFCQRHPGWKWALFPLQNGFLPGFFTGMLLLIIQPLPFWLDGDIWAALLLPLLILDLRYYCPRLSLVAATVLMLTVWYVAVCLAHTLQIRPLLPMLTAAAALGALPASIAYIRSYIHGGTTCEDRP